jgi:septum formation protein
MDIAPSILLASQSPRRRQLLALGGWVFETGSADLDETRMPGELPHNYVRRLAIEKACALRAQARREHLIIGADTAVVIDGDVLGKPSGEDEAREMLLRLRGRTHQVYTGIAVYCMADGTISTSVVITDVPMRAYDEQEIDRYVKTGDPLDKAGAYGIQNPVFQPVARMEGCYASVMGFPLCSISFLLRKAGLVAGSDLARNCQETIRYNCSVFPTFLRGEVTTFKVK